MRDDDYLIFLGMDPALQGDYFGVCAHALPSSPPADENMPWVPYLVKLMKLHAENYSDMWKALNGGILEQFSNFYHLQIDYTNEKTMADFLEDKYGESRITKTPFTKGESGSKMRLAQNSLSWLKSGYNFPDHHKITDPIERENIRMLKQQIINEEVVLNPDGSVKFRHKGAHNDLLHGWMLSLDSCMEYALGRQGRQGRHVIGGIGNKINVTSGMGAGFGKPDYKTDSDVVAGLTGEW